MRHLLLFIGLILAKPALALPEEDRDYENIRRVATLKTDSRVESVAISPDSKLLAGGFNGRITIWDSKLERLETLVLEDNVRVAPDPATAEIDPLHRPSARERWVLHLAFSPDSKWIAAACSDGTLRQWNVENAKGTIFSDPVLSGQNSPLLSHEGQVQHLAYSPDGAKILSGSDDKTAKLWDAKTGALLFSFKPHQNEVAAVAFSADGSHVTTLSGSKKAPYISAIKIWNATSGLIEKTMTLNAFSANFAALSGDAQFALISDYSGIRITIRLCNAVTGEVISREKFVARAGPAAFSYYGGIVVVSEPGGRLSPEPLPGPGLRLLKIPPGFRILDIFRGGNRVTARSETDYWESVAQSRDVAISRTAGSIAFACNNGTIELWSAR